MRVLFLIPKNNPPELSGNFSKAFKEFVAMCLNKDPNDRPSARELLKHRFIRMAKKNSFLVELIDRHKRWKAINKNDDDDSSSDDSGGENDRDKNDVKWTFDIGTVKGPKSPVVTPPNSMELADKMKKSRPRSKALSNVLVPLLTELSQKYGAQGTAVEELLGAFHKAEDKAPGISDKLVEKLCKTVQR